MILIINGFNHKWFNSCKVEQYGDYTLNICEQHDINFALKQLEEYCKVLSKSVHSHSFKFNAKNKLKPLYRVKKNLAYDCSSQKSSTLLCHSPGWHSKTSRFKDYKTIMDLKTNLR